MVEIVGLDESKFKQTTCRSCGSILKYCNAEIKEEYRSHYDGSRDLYSWIECPKCHDDVYVR